MTTKLDNIGVFVCHCGLNIAEAVDIDRVVEEISCYPGVVLCDDYMYMCSDPGQDMIRKAIREHGLKGVVNANCAPSLHEKTFRRAVAAEGVNPYLQETANIREFCSWPHAKNRIVATAKAISIVKAAIERLRLNMALTPSVIPVTKRALVIGGGIAGMQAALDIADGGYPVVLVERAPEIGGHVAQLSHTFLTLDNARALITPMIDRVTAHPKISVLCGTEIEEVDGYVGNFVVKLRRGDSSTITEEKVGAVVTATGYDLFPRERLSEFDMDPDVIDGLEFERMLAPDGPTGGQVRRPSDGTEPRQVVFLQCCGTRDPEHGVTYCSRVCCMVTAKQALLYKQKAPDGQAYIFYMDMRSDAKGFEEFQQRVIEEQRLLYLRGRVSRVFRDGDRLKVWGADTLTGKSLEIDADLVVLALGMTPSVGALELARKLNTMTDENGFFTEAHLKLRPVETLTSGVYLAGTAQWPRDIPDTLSSASGAASKILSLFSRQELLHEPTTAAVDEEVCVGCGQCVSTCSYKAIELDPDGRVAVVNDAVCEGCGACAVTCPSKAMRHKNATAGQFMKMIEVACGEY